MSTSMGIWNATVEIQRNRPHVTLPMATQMAEALDAAGLLVTPLHERAVAACEMYAKGIGNMAHLAAWAVPVRDIGRESLASKKPKERWTMRLLSGDLVPARWGVYSSNSDSAYAMFSGSEPQARCVADALNKLEAK